MKVNRPGSPLGGSDPLEPLDPRDLRAVIKGERFASVLNELDGQTAQGAQQTGSNEAATATSGSTGKRQATRGELERIARSVNLNDPEQARTAVRESADLMVRAGLAEEYREHPQAARLVAEIGDFIASDPMLKSRLLSILTKLQSA